MDREIKFRGVTTKGEMVFGSLVVTNAFVPHMPKQHTKTWIVESSLVMVDGLIFVPLKQ